MNSGIGLLGCLAIYALLNLMAVSGVAICKYSLELQHILAVWDYCVDMVVGEDVFLRRIIPL